MPLPLLMRVCDVATLTGLSRWTINDLCKSGDLLYVPLSRRRRRIRTDSVMEWIKRSTVSKPDDLKRLMDGRRK